MLYKKVKSNNTNSLTRRQFIRKAGITTAALSITGTSTRQLSGKTLGANERIGVGFIGCGGRSQAHLQTVHYLKTQKHANIDIVVATGGKFRYQEREIPDTFNMLIDYPEKITVAVLGTQANDYPATNARGSGQRIPVIRGWEGTLTIQNSEIVFIPAQGSKKKPQRFPIEGGEDFVGYWQKFLDCCRSRKTETLSPMELAYHVQTALQMGMLGLREGKVARFNSTKEEILL